MPIFAPNWILSQFTTWIFGGVRILLVGQCMYVNKKVATFLIYYNAIGINFGAQSSTNQIAVFSDFINPRFVNI